MLAGLIFAVHDADDRAGMLAATLPFAGLTLIEYQARLLIGAGASQIIVVVARLTPELIGAVARIGRRGVTVDTVRNAAEAAAKLHPLSHLLVLADGLVTTEAMLAPFAREGGDLLLAIDEAEAPTGMERIGGHRAWAGIARLDGRRLGEVAALPRDYDVQSALLLCAGQAGATQLPLPEGEARAGHGIERRAATLAARGDAVLAAGLARRTGWFDRWVVRPAARLAMPPILRRNLPTATLAGGSAAVAAAGCALVAFGQPAIGLLAVLAGSVGGRLAGALAWLRDEARLAHAITIGLHVAPALAALLLGRAIDAEAGELTGEVIALALVIAGALGGRAATRPAGSWVAEPPALLAGLTLFTLLGMPTAGLAAMALYAAASLAARIEALRQP